MSLLDVSLLDDIPMSTENAKSGQPLPELPRSKDVSIQNLPQLRKLSLLELVLALAVPPPVVDPSNPSALLLFRRGSRRRGVNPPSISVEPLEVVRSCDLGLERRGSEVGIERGEDTARVGPRYRENANYRSEKVNKRRSRLSSTRRASFRGRLTCRAKGRLRTCCRNAR